jgi:L-histidine N-alpha-methyltransferase
MSLARVAIHSSQFPEAVRADLLESLRSRQINHKFHYDSFKQTRKWLALHEVYSPARTDANCREVYQASFGEAIQHLKSGPARVIGLGCGGGQKDAALLELLHRTGREVWYTPTDVSTAMVLVARQRALGVVPEAHCFPLVCDLATAADLNSILPHQPAPNVETGTEDQQLPAAARVFTFFGMLPNFEPEVILPRLSSLIESADFLLLSANLAPGTDYAAGAEKVLPLYDNPLTRDWLLTFLLDLGIEQADGELRFTIETQDDLLQLRRITAYFQFVRARAIEVDSETFQFRAGESIRLFFSYRHTPALVRELLGLHHLRVVSQWITASQEEGVFLATR